MRRSRWFHSTKHRLERAAAAASVSNARRRGSTIVVVIALLLALTFLGIVGYTVGTQEHSNATFFSDGAKNLDFGLSRDTLFDWSLRQIILGTYPEERQSALYGGHMSLLPTMFGNDMVPYDGQGVHLSYVNSGSNIVIVEDQDHDPNTPPTNPAFMQLNRAPFSHGANAAALDQINYPAPDVGYNYWDINSPYLSLTEDEYMWSPDGRTRDESGSPGNPVRMALPSYHRPQILRSLIDPNTGNLIPASEWYSNDATQKYVLRPHEDHLAVASDGTVTNIFRFISAAHPDMRNNVPLAQRLTSFPFTANTGAPTNNDANPANDGVWDGLWDPNPTAAANSLANHVNFSYDADPDGDGFNEAIWLDLGFPMQIRENPDGTISHFVPMFGVTIYDADALFNLNAHGNLSGIFAFDNPFGLGPGPDRIPGNADDALEFASQSNQGLGPSEVNPQWGMLARPSDGDTTQHQRQPYFQHAPINNVELSNMEWWFLLSGRADLDSSNNVDKLYPGRNGDLAQLDTAMNSSPPLGPFSYPKAGNTFGAYPDPATFNIPGDLEFDDNQDARLGGQYNGSGSAADFPSEVKFPAWQQPLDLFGSGRFVDAVPQGDSAYGRRRRTALQGQHRWPAYGGYQHNHEIGLWAKPGMRFLMEPGTNRLRYHVDEPEEIILEPQYVRTDYDSIFGASENATLHLAQADQDNLNLKGRLRELAPVNFDGTDSAATEERRQRFTTTSWDLKSLGLIGYDAVNAPVAARTWEYANTGSFPPLQSMNVFREPVEELLRANTGTLENFHLRKLSINHLCDWEDPPNAPNASNLIFRPLTPHPSDDPTDDLVTPNDNYLKLPSTSVSQRFQTGGPETPQDLNNYMLLNPVPHVDPAAQEWLARRDRQRLCRDIYTLMYLFCGGDDVDYTQPGATVYPVATRDSNANGINDELEQMAQFVVNMVDRMDPDNVITRFEFDVDLSNGWSLDDDAFTTGDPDRQEVFGVEEQDLALNEAQIIWAKRVLINNDPNMPDDHAGTEYDDEFNRDFTFIELENVSREPVRFTNESWQIVVRPPATTATTSGGSVTGVERRLTFTGDHPGIDWGTDSVYLVAAAGDDHNKGNLGGTVPKSDFRVNRNYKHPEVGTPNEDLHPENNIEPYPLISPRRPLDASRSIDLIDLNNKDFFRINDAPGGGNFGDGTEATGPTKGGELLSLTSPSLDAIAEQDDRTINIEIELRRRLNPVRSTVIGYTADPVNHETQSRDNPWIVVDRIVVPMDVFTLRDTDDYDEIRPELAKMRTSERRDPLNRQNPLPFAQTIPAPNVGHWQNNSLGWPNILGNPNHVPVAVSYTPYGLYQKHFNRDYGSAMELMAVPLYGPFDTTQRLVDSDSPYTPGKAVVAADKFQHPEANSMLLPGNRWYRLFEFVDVPDRSHRHPELDLAGNPARPSYVINLGNRLIPDDYDPFYRRPGTLQLNTMRHPEVLGGLLDDTEVATLDLNPFNNLHLPDQAAGTGSGLGNRDWWVEFLRARDGIDPETYDTVTDPSNPFAMLLPGLPDGGKDSATGIQFGSRPFQPFSYSADGAESLQNTLLRNLPRDPSTAGNVPRSLFELGDFGQPLDHSMRYRMLEKVMNNSTTRSNVFLIFIQVDFFEAAEVTDPNTGKTVVRVGGKLDDSPGYRGFFVVDRSKAKYLISSQDLPATFPDPIDNQNKFNFSFNQGFDFHQLILHRQTIN